MTTISRRILDFPITRIIIAIIVCFSLFIVVQNFLLKPILYRIISDKDIADPIIHCLSVAVLLLGYYFLFRLYDKRNITELSLIHWPKDMLGGFAVGFLIISISIGILYLQGYYQFIRISADHYSLRLFSLLMIAAFIEDLFFRGIIIRECENWLGTNLTIVIGMLFEIDHIFNPNVDYFHAVIFLIWGFTMTMLFIYTKRIWLPFFFHLGWNFAQPFYGSNLTGLDDMGSIIQSKMDGPTHLTGGDLGIEGSVFTATFLLIVGIILYVLALKEGKIIKRRKTN
jgi:membrane protease YdiL (CAAX protease family)